MSAISRRLFLAIIAAVIPHSIGERSNAVTSKKPSPTPTKKPSPTPTKKSTPTPTKKSTPTPTPTTKKSTPTSTPKPSATSTSADASKSKAIDGVIIAKSSDLALKQTKIFYLKDSFGISTGYSLTRTGRGVVAFEIRCTHAGAPTALRDLKLECPAHGSIFNPETGEVVRGPAVSPLKSYQTNEIDGEIRIIIS